MRTDPPPSLVVARGTTPAASAAAEPPLEPPGERSVFHGLRVAPNTWLVVTAGGADPRRGRPAGGCAPPAPRPWAGARPGGRGAGGRARGGGGGGGGARPRRNGESENRGDRCGPRPGHPSKGRRHMSRIASGRDGGGAV